MTDSEQETEPPEPDVTMAVLHQKLCSLQESMEARFDAMNAILAKQPLFENDPQIFGPTGAQNIGDDGMFVFLSGFDLRNSDESAKRESKAVRTTRGTSPGPLRVSSISVNSQEGRFSEWRKSVGSLVWEATKTRRKTAGRQSQLMLERRASDDFHAESEGWSFRNCVGRVVNSAFVTQGVMLLVFAHVILLGIEVDISARSVLDAIPSWFSLVNLIIVGIFVLELLLKFIYLGCGGFWCGDDCGWNCFDFFIVAVSVADVIVDYWSQSLSDSIVMEELRVLRSLRFVRAVRSVRIIRIFRYMAALRTLVLSIVSTMSSLLWTLALLLVIIYAFGIILTQLVSEHCRFLKLDGGTCSDNLLRYWPSVPESMLTLFMTISSGLEWGDAIIPLRDVSFFAVFLVLLYVVITIFAVTNVVTGVFCQTAIESASNDKDVATMKQVSAKSQKMAQLKTIFQEMDRQNTNFVSFQDVKDAVNSPELRDFFESMGIISDDIWTWFMLLDQEQTGLVDLDAFVSGCMQLHGAARSMQMAKMSYENKVLRDAVAQMRSEVAQDFRYLHERLRKLTKLHDEDF